MNCSSGVSHNSQAASPPRCGPFSALGVADFVNSTAVALGTAICEANGSNIECTFGIRMPTSVGNTSLCVIGKLSKYTIIMHACLKHVSADLRVMMQWLLYLEYLTMHWIG